MQWKGGRVEKKEVSVVTERPEQGFRGQTCSVPFCSLLRFGLLLCILMVTSGPRGLVAHKERIQSTM